MKNTDGPVNEKDVEGTIVVDLTIDDHGYDENDGHTALLPPAIRQQTQDYDERVQLMVDFLYKCQYPVKEVIPHDFSMEPMLFHIGMYEIADRYDIESLRIVASSRLLEDFYRWAALRVSRRDCTPARLVPALRIMVEKAFSITRPVHGDLLRQTVIQCCDLGSPGNPPAFGQWMSSLVTAVGPEFGQAVLLYVMNRAHGREPGMHITEDAQCPKCGGRWKRLVEIEQRGRCRFCGCILDWTIGGRP